MVKLGYSEKATKFEKIFQLKFDVTEQRQILSGRFFQILWPSQNIPTLPCFNFQMHSHRQGIEEALTTTKGMALPIMEFQEQVYKIRKIFA